MLDLLFHNYAKPIVVWGEGYVMGGGLGTIHGCAIPSSYTLFTSCNA